MLEHRYGPNVHILHDPYLLSLLARLGAPDTGTETVPGLVTTAYRHLAREMLGTEFPVIQGRIATRMAATEPKAFYEGPILCRKTKLVICAVIRAVGSRRSSLRSTRVRKKFAHLNSAKIGLDESLK